MTANIRIGHVARHTPANAGAQGREAAVVDIAQDLLLRHLHSCGLLDSLAIKGGTAIRKLYAGREGRFSLDLDFAVADASIDPDEAALAFVTEVDGLEIEPFKYGVSERRGKWSVTFASPFVDAPTLATKLDFSPSPWILPAERDWVPLPIHAQYGEDPLPRIKTLRLEENISEKIARLNRTTTARDLYDLRWIASTPSVERFLDKALIRKLSVLKIWVDTNGMHAGATHWKPGHAGSVFKPGRWLRDRSGDDFDAEDIGALAVPAPSAKELSDAVMTAYAFLSDLDDDEAVVAKSDARDRSLVIRMISELPSPAFDPRTLF
ncbi:nucleotidyl transferase AbiEii/AbiGii toxin family protein [Arabiibacter massiliensis]|uniref:nucleotidyl transferase AbiEii/AbiGii toxin family protein n=1 Tax=Arabiibacter massiliensis TaxID=1870985 RepID=UPI00155AEE05|nr:nucleotidyl transferase AbiEii/AbiGii toxin family protein [Arabiibacter massiliensis]